MVETRKTGVLTAPKCAALIRPEWTARVSLLSSLSSDTGVVRISLGCRSRFHVRIALGLGQFRLIDRALLFQDRPQREVEDPGHHAGHGADHRAKQEELNL